MNYNQAYNNVTLADASGIYGERMIQDRYINSNTSYSIIQMNISSDYDLREYRNEVSTNYPIMEMSKKKKIPLEQIQNSSEIIKFKMDTEPTLCPISLEVLCSEEFICRIKYCGHIFNKLALYTWFENNTSCPVCRYDIRKYYHTSIGKMNDENMNDEDIDENIDENINDDICVDDFREILLREILITI
jgi:hypothetical protein